jgi:putative ABC transport system ATP-binding protein
MPRGWHDGGIDPTPLLRFDHVCVDGPHGPLVRDAHGDVPARGVTVLVGPSGAGKSTLLRLANRLEAATSGRVLLDGTDVATMDPRVLRRRVAMVFQRPTPFAGTVFDNLRVATPTVSRDAAIAALARADLDGSFLDRPADDLSGGEAQRMCVARTLVTDPEVVLMDEPTSSLDPQSTRSMERLARNLADGGVPVVWVTHDLDQMRRLADHVLVVIDGTIGHGGGPADLAGDLPAAVRAFLSTPTEEPS